MDFRRSQRRIRTRRLLLAVGACGVVAGVAVLAVYPPNESSFYPRCTFREACGLYCPGCGITRALHSLFNGQFQQAIAYNGVGLVLLAVTAISMARSLWAWASDERVGETVTRYRPWLAWTIGVALTLYWIARNLPMEPFPVLAPHELRELPTTEKKEAESPYSSRVRPGTLPPPALKSPT